MPDCDSKVAMLPRIFPHEAKNIKRLIGFRKFAKVTKVTKIKVVPTIEKQEATRSTVSNALSCASFNREAMLNYTWA